MSDFVAEKPHLVREAGASRPEEARVQSSPIGVEAGQLSEGFHSTVHGCTGPLAS